MSARLVDTRASVRSRDEGVEAHRELLMNSVTARGRAQLMG